MRAAAIRQWAAAAALAACLSNGSGGAAPDARDRPHPSLVPAGRSAMGDASGAGWDDERPVHTVALSAFLIDRYEVTNADMRRVLQWALEQGRVRADATRVWNTEGLPRELLDIDDWNSEVTFADGRLHVKPGRERFPCVEVTWYGALAYCHFRSLMEGLTPCIDFERWTCDFGRDGYRLPTEAEWERAARGGLEQHWFPWPGRGGQAADHLAGHHANFWESGDSHENDAETRTRTTPVGYYDGNQTPAGPDMANGYGLYDMAGNVWEWCWDVYAPDCYARPEAARPNPTGPAVGVPRVLRGGSWLSGQKGAPNGEGTLGAAALLRCANRSQDRPDSARWNRGFRCVRRP